MPDDKKTFDSLLTTYNGGRFHGAAAKLAKALGVTNTTVAGWRSGELPGEDNQIKVAKEMGISVAVLRSAFAKAKVQKIKEEQEEYLPGLPGPRDIAKEQPLDMSTTMPVQFVPVVGTVSAETFTCAIEETVPDEVLPFPLSYKGKKVFALRIKGGCMEPLARDGDYAFVVQTPHVDEGQLAVIRLNGDCTLKRVFRKKDHILLKPDNPSYKPLTVKTGELNVVGVVVMFGKKP